MAAEKKGGNLPPVLYLQLDNCWRENKNTTMFGYLSWLVHMRYFLKICVGFLLVGYVVRQRIRRMHTPAFHSQPWGSFWPGTSFDNASGGCTRLPFTRNPGCQTLRKAKNIFKIKQGFLTRSSIYIYFCWHTKFGCDQVFSRHSIYLQHHNAKTLPQLKAGFEASWEDREGMGRLQCIELTEAADYKEWLRPHLDPRLHHHTTAHQYVFESKVHNGVNQVVMTAKNFSVSREDNWCTVGCIMRVRRLHHCRSVFFPVIGCKPGDVIENTRIQSAITVEHSPFLPIRLVKRRPCRRAAPCRQPGVRCSSSTYRTCRRQACPRENTWRWWRRNGCARAA